MSGSHNDESLTFRQALEALGEKDDDLGHEYFRFRECLDLSPSMNNPKYSHITLYNHLGDKYRKELLRVHSDKGGTGCTETFMRVKKAWGILKGCFSLPIDLTLDSSDTDSDEENCQSLNGDHDDSSSLDSRSDIPKEDGGGAVVIRSDSRTTTQAIEHDQTTEDMHAGGTVQPFTGKSSSQWTHLIGRTVKKNFWFKGRIKSIEVVILDGRHQVLFWGEFDDNDGEEYTLEEVEKLTQDDDCNLVAGNIGFEFWKAFPLVGKVTGIVGESGKNMSCSC